MTIELYIWLALIALAYLVLMWFAGRAHGAATHDEVTGAPTGWPTWGKLAAKIAYAGSFAGANLLIFGVWWIALIFSALTWFGISTGHGRFYAMNGANINDPNPEWIEKYIASWLYRGDITKPRYSWFCMGVKGVMVSAPLLPLTIPAFWLWPWAYSRSFKKYNDSAPAEHYVGLISGVFVVVAVIGKIIFALN